MWIAAAMIGCLLLAGALLLLARARHQAALERIEVRVGSLAAADADDVLVGLHRLDGIRNPWLRGLCRWLWSAGFRASPARVAMLALLWSVLTVLAAIVLGVIGVGLAVFVALVAVLGVAQRKRARRRQLSAQLPSFLGYLQRALTAGNTLEEGIHAAAQESAEPIRGVFVSVSRQVRLGAALADTLSEAAQVNDLRALHILAMSARVNRRFGGSMRRVIGSLIETIRHQEAAARELKALTGETRFSAYVVAAIPVAISVFFYVQNPQYYADMLTSAGGRVAIGVALVLEALGLFIIWRMMSRLLEPDA